MPAFATLSELLDFAIREEEHAHAFYTQLAARMDDETMRRTFESFAAEELGHKRRLLAIKAGERFEPDSRPVNDLKIADYLVAVVPTADMTYQDALILAMQKEKAAFRLYSDMAEQLSDPDMRKTMRALAQEEARHKLRFEVEYDEIVLDEH